VHETSSAPLFDTFQSPQLSSLRCRVIVADSDELKEKIFKKIVINLGCVAKNEKFQLSKT
jgi:hypothetical protein